MAKTNTGLVNFAYSKLGVAYVYGSKGEILTLDRYNLLKKLYPNIVRSTDVKKVGQWCTDCSGLISWYTKNIKSSSMYHDEATKVNKISTIAKAPEGAAVWRKGHIGIYVGNGYAIEARGSAYGVVKTAVASRDWTHWFLIKEITYEITNYYPAYTGNSASIVDALNSLNITSTYAYRKKIAKANSISGYLGLASQNRKLLALLKAGKLIKA